MIQRSQRGTAGVERRTADHEGDIWRDGADRRVVREIVRQQRDARRGIRHRHRCIQRETHAWINGGDASPIRNACAIGTSDKHTHCEPARVGGEDHCWIRRGAGDAVCDGDRCPLDRIAHSELARVRAGNGRGAV